MRLNGNSSLTRKVRAVGWGVEGILQKSCGQPCHKATMTGDVFFAATTLVMTWGWFMTLGLPHYSTDGLWCRQWLVTTGLGALLTHEH